MVRPPDILISLAEAATAQWMMRTAPLVCSAAFATGEAFPAAAESEVIALAIATPVVPLAAAKGVAESGRVAATAPGAVIVPASRKVRVAPAPRRAVTALVAAAFADPLCVVAMKLSPKFKRLNHARSPSDLDSHP
jgi:hypothetical protein